MFSRIGIAFVTYGLVLVGLGLIAAQPAQAYRVKKICEDVATKTGTVEKCRWVLDKESLEPPQKSDKDAKKADAGAKK
jgi:hypothetical protein